MTAEPSWNDPAPLAAVKVFVTALQHAAHLRAEAACLTVADADPPAPRWVFVQSVDTLAGACRGDDTAACWEKLREECTMRALEAAAPDEQLRASLGIVALAEARERGAQGRVDELTAVYVEEFGVDVLACVSVQLAGMVTAARHGDGTGALFARMRAHYGIDP